MGYQSFFLRALAALACCTSLLASAATGEDCVPELTLQFPPPPKLASSPGFKAFLKANLGYRVVRYEDVAEDVFRAGCLPDAAAAAQHKKFVEEGFAPFIVADTNRDGISDLVVVLVKQGKFSVVVLHGKDADLNPKAMWVVKDAEASIVGTKSGEGYVLPLFCLECCNSGTYLWTGEVYELGAHPVGEWVCLDAGAVAYSKQNHSSSSPVWKTAKRSAATVVAVGGADNSAKNARWYRVKLRNQTLPAGYVSSKMILEEPVDCDAEK